MEEKNLLQDFTETLSPESEAAVKAMFEAGLHWGKRRSLTHPKMRPFIFASRGELEIIDLSKTLEALEEAKQFIRDVVTHQGMFLLIGTQPAARTSVKEIAGSLGMPYVVNRWLGGTLTNFKTFQTRIRHLKELEEKMKSTDFEHYTKRERLEFTKEYEELKEKFEGLTSMRELPTALFVLGISHHVIPIREAKRRGIRVVAVVNTNDDPNAVDYPIPANDNASTSIKFLTNFFRKTVEEMREGLITEVTSPTHEVLPASPQ